MNREAMGLIVKRDDGSEIVNYDNPAFPSYIYDGWGKPRVTWEKVPHFHEDIELIAVKEGNMSYSVNGREITLEITHHMFMSVIWVNFLGYMFETPAMVYFSLKTAAKRDQMPLWKQLLAAVGIGVSGVAFVGAASGISLLLNAVTDEWFACIAFVLLWCFVSMMVIRRCIGAGARISSAKNQEVPTLIYWTAMYGFSIAALIHLGIASAVPVYFIFGIVMFAGTLFLAVRE